MFFYLFKWKPKEWIRVRKMGFMVGEGYSPDVSRRDISPYLGDGAVKGVLAHSGGHWSISKSKLLYHDVFLPILRMLPEGISALI